MANFPPSLVRPSQVTWFFRRGDNGREEQYTASLAHYPRLPEEPGNLVKYGRDRTIQAQTKNGPLLRQQAAESEPFSQFS